MGWGPNANFAREAAFVDADPRLLALMAVANVVAD